MPGRPKQEANKKKKQKNDRQKQHHKMIQAQNAVRAPRSSQLFLLLQDNLQKSSRNEHTTQHGSAFSSYAAPGCTFFLSETLGGPLIHFALALHTASRSTQILGEKIMQTRKKIKAACSVFLVYRPHRNRHRFFSSSRSGQIITLRLFARRFYSGQLGHCVSRCHHHRFQRRRRPSGWFRRCR